MITKPYIKRALRTFFQAAVGYALVNIAAIDLTAESAVRGLIISAIAAGIAAAMNLNEKENENEKGN